MSHFIALFDPCTDILAFQEVGGTKQLQSISPDLEKGFQLFEYLFADDELEDYFVFGTEQVDSYLGQMILIARETVEFIHSSFAGSRVIGVHYRDCSGHDRRIFSVHLPHQDSSDDVFNQAVEELQAICKRHRTEEVLLIGDFNVEPHTQRAAFLDECLSHFKFKQYRPQGPTRFGHDSSSALDFAYISDRIFRRMMADQSQISVISGSRHEIGSDHDRISLELIFGERVKQQRKGRNRRRKARGKCGRWSTRSDISAGVQCCVGFHSSDLWGQWESLKSLQAVCSYRTPTCKYQDSQVLKSMCQERRLTVDPL